MINRSRYYLIRTILGTLLLCCTTLRGSIQPEEKDSVTFGQAQDALDQGDYSRAIQLYELINLQEVEEEKRINGVIINDLSSYYSIDELAIEEEKQRVEFLQQTVYLLCGLLAIGLFLWLILRWSKRRNGHYNQKLNEAIEKERQSIRGKSLLLANMSHEIRTPLNALSGFSEILTLEEIDSDTQEQCNDVIQLNSELLLKLINDVLDITSLDVGQMKFHLSQCNAIQLCEKVVKTVNQVKTNQVPILLQSKIDNLEFTTDPTRFQQVLINLLMNASKFTSEGEIILMVEKISEKTVSFSVTDTGCGIPACRSQAIFSRFEKLDEKAQGTGLGLSICKVIVKRLGGNIWLDTSYSAGARFVVTHPINSSNL